MLMLIKIVLRVIIALLYVYHKARHFHGFRGHLIHEIRIWCKLYGTPQLIYTVTGKPRTTFQQSVTELESHHRRSYIVTGKPHFILKILLQWYVGMQRLCRNNFGHNRYVWESGIMLAF